MNPLPLHLRDKVLTATASTPALTRDRVRLRSLLLVALGFAVALGVFAKLGGLTLVGRSLGFVLAVAVGWTLVASVATWSSLGRGKSMLGRASQTLGLVTLVSAPVVYAWVTGCTLAAASFGDAAPWTANLHCLSAALVLSAAPFVAFALARRGSDPVHPRMLGAALGAAAGAWGGVLIDLHCPMTHWLHVAFAHVLPILAFALVGALTGKRVLGLR